MSTCSLFSFTRFVVPVDANRDLQSVNALMGILAFRLLRRTSPYMIENNMAQSRASVRARVSAASVDLTTLLSL